MNTPGQKTRKEIRCRWMAIVVVIVLIASGFVVWTRTGEETALNHPVQKKPTVAMAQLPKSVSLETITAETVCPKVVYPGIVQAFETTKLAFRVGGPLVEINVKPGDRVKKGDVLMQIDPRDFVSEVESIKAKIQAAQSRLTAMKTGARPEDIKLLEAALQSAQSKTRFCDSEYRRIHALYEQKVVSDTEHEQAYDNMIAAQMALSKAEQELEKGRNGERKEEIAATEADILNMEVSLRISEDRLKDTTLRASFDGIVTNRSIENYEMVTTSPNHKEVIALHDISRLKIRVSLPDKELLHRSINEGFTANIRFSCLPGETFVGNLYEIDTQPNATNGLYAATFVVTAPENVNILPGMVAEATIDADHTQVARQLLVPAEAVLAERDGRYFVWCVENNRDKAEKRIIRRGPLTSNNRYIVLDGLREGDRVVTQGSRFLADGVKIALNH